MSSKPPSSDLKITSKSRTQGFRNVSKNSNCRFKLSKCVKLIFILRLATSIWKIPSRRMTKKIPRKLLHHENDFIAKWSIKFLKTYSSLLEKSKIIMSNSFPYKNVQLIESGCMTLRLHEKKRRIDYFCFIEILISNAFTYFTWIVFLGLCKERK